MKVVIVGAGSVGTHLAKLLSGEHVDCVLIDADIISPMVLSKKALLKSIVALDF